MKIKFTDYDSHRKWGGYVYSSIKFDKDYGDMIVTVNPNTEFEIFKYNDGRITVERMKNGIRICWVVSQDVLNWYFKRTPSKASMQTEIMEI